MKVENKKLRLIYRLFAFFFHQKEGLASVAHALALRRYCLADKAVTFGLHARVSNGQSADKIVIRRGSAIYGFIEVLPHGGSVQVGEDCFLGENSYLWSAAGISVGDRVLISHGVNIHDHNAHSLSARARHAHYTGIISAGHPLELPDVPNAPVTIEEDAWIGFNATVLKGVTIGRGAIVGAGSVVTKNVAPYTIVVGNPAREIGKSLL